MDDAMPAGAVAVPKESRGSQPLVKFPCGHLEARAAVGGGERVIWVGCRSCNLVVLAIGADAPLPARQRRGCRPHA